MHKRRPSLFLIILLMLPIAAPIYGQTSTTSWPSWSVLGAFSMLTASCIGLGLLTRRTHKKVCALESALKDERSLTLKQKQTITDKDRKISSYQEVARLATETAQTLNATLDGYTQSCQHIQQRIQNLEQENKQLKKQNKRLQACTGTSY